MRDKREWVTMRDNADGRVHHAPFQRRVGFWPIDHPCLARRASRTTEAVPTCLWCVAYWIRNG